MGRGRIVKVTDGRLSMGILVLGNLMLLFYRRELQIIMEEDLNKYLSDCQLKLNQLKNAGRRTITISETTKRLLLFSGKGVV